VARNYDPQVREFFEVFNIQVVSSTSWGAQRIEELLYHTEARAVFSAGNGEVEVYELAIPGEWSGKTIAGLIPCEDCKPIAITRAGKAFLAGLETVMKEGDVLSIAATFDGIEQTRKLMQAGPKEA